MCLIDTFLELMENWSPYPDESQAHKTYKKKKNNFVGKIARANTPMEEAFKYLKGKGLLPSHVTVGLSLNWNLFNAFFVWSTEILDTWPSIMDTNLFQ